jgi:hypothetical protein
MEILFALCIVAVAALIQIPIRRIFLGKKDKDE